MRADRVQPAGTWDLATAIDEVHLDHQDRFRRRILLRTEARQNMLLNLAATTHLRQNDGLITQHGIVRVHAKPEPLMSIKAPPHTLLRLAWHLGNRHLPVQILPAELRLHRDHVIADLACAQGAEVTDLQAAFDPEPGAYDPHAYES